MTFPRDHFSSFQFSFSAFGCIQRELMDVIDETIYKPNRINEDDLGAICKTLS